MNKYDLPDELKPPLPPNPYLNQASASPTRPPGSRWTTDPGAIPGEPELFLDWTEENEPKAAIEILELPDAPDHELYVARLGNGDTLGVYDDLAKAARALEYIVERQPACRECGDLAEYPSEFPQYCQQCWNGQQRRRSARCQALST